MIVEFRTYTLQPGSVATVEERFGQALPARAKLRWSGRNSMAKRLLSTS